jgi:hypothetical protein
MKTQPMAYCVYEKVMRPMKNAKLVMTKNGRERMAGTCSVCGNKMSKFV